MRTVTTNYEYDPKKVINGAVASEFAGPFCMGYLNPGASGQGYISTLKLSIGLVSVDNLDEVTEGIVSYDRCEKNDAYIGQINMLTASSFCGLNGAVWGYDLAVADRIKNGLEPMYYQPQVKGPDIPVFSAAPLLDATERLFGKKQQPRFPPMPGAHIVCANKSATTKADDTPDGTWVWSAIALAILENRSSGANLFIEDANTFETADTPKPVVKEFLEETQKKITHSIALCGQDQGVIYKEIFVGYKALRVQKNQVGCALTCAPYVLLSPQAIPAKTSASDLMTVTISDWEKALNLSPLPPGPVPPKGFLGPNGKD